LSKKSALPASRRHISLYDEDWEYLAEAFGPNSESKLGPGPTIQKIVHVYVQKLKDRERERRDQLPGGTKP
jgi:hypothetical protein